MTLKSAHPHWQTSPSLWRAQILKGRLKLPEKSLTLSTAFKHFANLLNR
jgi:hypothetical protein